MRAPARRLHLAVKAAAVTLFALLAIPVVAPAAGADPISDLVDTSPTQARVHCLVVATFDGSGEDCL